jgi:tRNA pseudouridine38-40 synthase
MTEARNADGPPAQPSPPKPTPTPASAPAPAPGLRNVRLVIAYDGSRYHGWQRQPGGLETIQGTLESVLGRICNHPVATVGAGRTDAGVHAMGQVASFRTTSPIPPDRLAKAVNSRLPPDITVVRASDVPPAFHATRSAVCKLYRYTVHNSQRHPVHDHVRVYHWWRPCEVEPMRAAAKLLLGRHHFGAFESAGSQRADKVRTLMRLEVFRDFERVHFDVQGDGFLYNMVRNLVGTLLEVGRGHRPPEWVAEVLASRDRRNAGPLAPASGLCLRWVKYPPLRELAALPDPLTQRRTAEATPATAAEPDGGTEPEPGD